MKKCSAIRLAAAIAVFGSTAHTMADHVVLQSASEAYPQGQLIAENSIIELNEGESLVLMSDDSDVIEVSGPFRGIPTGTSSEDFDMRTALTDLINNPDNVYASLGSTRQSGIGSEANEQRPAWALDPFETGVQCTKSDLEPQFWRPDISAELMLIIQRPGTEGSGKLVWAAGESNAEWPVDLPMVDNELHVVRRPGWMENAMFRLVIIPDSVTRSLETSIAWMAIYGCKKQAQLLLRGLRPPL